MDFSFPGAFPDQQIDLTFRKEKFKRPHYVLVFAFQEGKLLFTHHKKRGWELPGGTRHAAEWPIRAAIREVYEETGAELASIEPIGQYTMSYPDQSHRIKSIYVAQIQQIHPLPPGFETDGIQLLMPPPNAEYILSKHDFSLLLKDDVYRFTLPVALSVMNKQARSIDSLDK